MGSKSPLIIGQKSWRIGFEHLWYLRSKITRTRGKNAPPPKKKGKNAPLPPKPNFLVKLRLIFSRFPSVKSTKKILYNIMEVTFFGFLIFLASIIGAICPKI